MIIFCVIWIPIVAVVKILKAEGNIFQVRAQRRSSHCPQFCFSWHYQECLCLLLESMLNISRYHLGLYTKEQLWCSYPRQMYSNVVWYEDGVFLRKCAHTRVTALLSLKNSPECKVWYEPSLAIAFQRIASCCRPTANWGPYLECHRGERYSHVVTPKKEKEHEIPTVSGFTYIREWDGSLDDQLST